MNRWWLLWYMLSETKSLPEKLSWVRPSDLLQRFLLLIRMLCLCFLDLNLTMTVSFFLKWWQTWRLSGLTSWLASDNALQTVLWGTSSPIEAGTGFISRDSWQWYCTLLAALLSSWTILSSNKRLQLLLAVISEERISYQLRKSSKRLVRSDSLEDISSTLISFSINSSFERFSSWIHVCTIMIYKYRWQYEN